MKKLGCLSVVALFVVAIGLNGYFTPKEDAAPVYQSPRIPVPTMTIDKSPEAQKKREALLQDLLNKELALKIEGRYFYATPAFLMLDIDSKTKFMSMFWAYLYEASDKYASVVIKDSISGKELGTYTPTQGLRMQ